MDLDPGFGILRVKTRNVPITKKRQYLYFMCDTSSSMMDQGKDGKTKMDHSILTIQNILRLVSEEEETDIWIKVLGFDEEVDVFVSEQRITRDNVDGLIKEVEKMVPKNGTNFEMALQYTQEDLVKEECKEKETTYFFITDGDITQGSFDLPTLSSMVKEEWNSHFIGLGKEHSAETLIHLSSSKRSASYFFVDKIETCGLAFGEMVHSILYKSLLDVRISCKGGLLYDYKQGKWVEELFVGSLTGGLEKTYHIQSSDPYSLDISVFSEEKDVCTVFFYPDLVGEEKEPMSFVDLSFFVYRQRTMDLLFRAQYSIDRMDMLIVKNDMKELMEEMILCDKDLMESLINDLRVAIQTIGTRYGTMYISSRNRSCGEECVYTNDVECTTLLNRQYMTPRIVQMMRSVSDSTFLPEPSLRALG